LIGALIEGEKELIDGMRTLGRLLQVVLVLGLSLTVADASVIRNLYEVKYPVESQTRSERQAAIKSAFEELLIRITGDETIASKPQAAEMLDKSSQYVRQFSYELIPASLLDTVDQAPGENFLPTDEPEPQRVISVLFDEEAVTDALWQAKLPFWDKARPDTLVWVAVEDEISRYILDASQPSAVLEALRINAERRGAPIIFPLLDLEDQLNINVADVWGNYESTIRAASERYGTDTILAGRIVKDPFGGWRARWTIYKPTEQITWDARSVKLERVAGSGINHLASDLASRYAQVSSGEGENDYILQVHNVRNLKDYVRASRFIEQLAPIKDVRVENIEPQSVTYNIQLRGNRAGLEQAIALTDTLVAQPLELSIPTDRLLSYRLQ
jgi:hypothetical protein